MSLVFHYLQHKAQYLSLNWYSEPLSSLWTYSSEGYCLRLSRSSQLVWLTLAEGIGCVWSFWEYPPPFLQSTLSVFIEHCSVASTGPEAGTWCEQSRCGLWPCGISSQVSLISSIPQMGWALFNRIWHDVWISIKLCLKYFQWSLRPK